MLKLKNRATSPLEIVILSVFVTAVLTFILSHFQPDNNILNMFTRNFDPDLNEMITKWKNEADLIIVGKLVNRYEEVDGSHMSDFTGLVFFDVAIDKVEKGNYPYGEIEVYIGAYSNVIKLKDYPPFVKKNYRIGDKLRIYAYYDQVQNIYYTPGALMTVEPVL